MRATPRARKCCRCATLVSHKRRFFSTAAVEVEVPVAEEVPVATVEDLPVADVPVADLPVAVEVADLPVALAVAEEEDAAAAPAIVLDTDAHHCGV